MIIKCSRVRARGPALKRLIDHVENAEDNEQVVAIRGNFADLWDARRDARQFGREYAVAHWILSPARLATDEQMADAVVGLAEEYGFDLTEPWSVATKNQRQTKLFSIAMCTFSPPWSIRTGQFSRCPTTALATKS